jgi:ribonuclease P protein component
MVNYAGLISKFTKKEIDQLFETSHRILHSEQVTILAAPSPKEYARILIIIPRKVGNSVKRHLLRRRIKSVFYQEQLYQKLNHDLVFIARKAITKLSFQEIKDLILKAVHSIT